MNCVIFRSSKLINNTVITELTSITYTKIYYYFSFHTLVGGYLVNLIPNQSGFFDTLHNIPTI